MLSIPLPSILGRRRRFRASGGKGSKSAKISTWDRSVVCLPKSYPDASGETIPIAGTRMKSYVAYFNSLSSWCKNGIMRQQLVTIFFTFTCQFLIFTSHYEKLHWWHVMLRRYGVAVPACHELRQTCVNAACENFMQTKQIDINVNIQDPFTFKLDEQFFKLQQNSTMYVPPQSFNTFVVHWASYYHTSFISILLHHIMPSINIFTSHVGAQFLWQTIS